MRRPVRIIRRRLVAASFVLGTAAPAVSGQPAAGIDLSQPGTPSTAESGKPTIGGPPAVPRGQSDTAGCAPALPCGTRLLGTVRKNGAIELQVPALRW